MTSQSLCACYAVLMGSLADKKNIRLALALAMVSATVLPFVDAMVKILVRDYPVIMVAWARMGVSALFLGLLGARQVGTTIWRPKAPRLQVIRGLAAVWGTSFAFLGFRYMPLAECLAIVLTAPLIANLMSRWWLREHGSIISWWAALASFAGVLLIVRPGSALFSWHVMYPLAGAFGLATYLTLTRALAGKDAAPVTGFFGPLVSFIVFSMMMPWSWETPKTLSDLVMFLAIGTFAGLANLVQIYAYRHATTHQIAPISYVSVVIAMGIAWWIFHSVPDAFAVAGMLIIVAAGMVAFSRS